MDFKKQYQDRVVGAGEAVSHIHSGDRVFLTGNCSVPKVTLGALVEHAPNFEDKSLILSITFPDRSSLQDAWKHVSKIVGPDTD